jgi:hypothetical protein
MTGAMEDSGFVTEVHHITGEVCKLYTVTAVKLGSDWITRVIDIY